MSMGLKINHQIDVDTRTAYLIGDVDDDMYTKVVNTMMVFPSGSITFVLNTDGGDVYQALAIYDQIRARGKCTIIAEGKVMSAGTIILQAAAWRLARPNCQFLVHYGEDSNRSGMDLKHNVKLLRRVCKIFEERLTVTPRRIRSWFDRETYFDVDNAAECGMIDGVTE